MERKQLLYPHNNVGRVMPPVTSLSRIPRHVLCRFLVSESGTYTIGRRSIAQNCACEALSRSLTLQSLKNCFDFNRSSTISAQVISFLNIYPNNARRMPDLSLLSWKGSNVNTHTNMSDALIDDGQEF